MNAIKAKDWLKLLAGLAAVTGTGISLAFPVLAQFHSPDSLFQPSVHRLGFESGDDISITETLAEDEVFEKFSRALERAGISEKLEQNQFLTIFAPTNEAFDSWLAKQLLQPDNSSELAQVIAYHVVPGVVPKEIVETGSGEVLTLEGSPVRININQYGEVRLNDARGLHPSTPASNGVIVRIDKVLMPPDGVESRNASREFTIHNNTGQNVVKLYVESSGSQLWGMNEIGYDVLQDGDSIRGKLASDCLYDIKATLDNGEQIEYRQVDTCSRQIFSLAPRAGLEPKAPAAVATTATLPGFYCDRSTGTPQTRYRNSSGAAEVWISWNSDFFSSSGYNPLNRCQIVSGRLENYRRQGQLNFIGVGAMNGQTIICTAVDYGSCNGLIYTLKPYQNPEQTLQQFLQHRMGVAGVQPLFESEDDAPAFPAFIDVRPFIEVDTRSNPVTSPSSVNATPQRRRPHNGEAMRDL